MKYMARLLGESGLAALVACFFAACGFVFGTYVAPVVHSRKLPWIVARATGLGAFLALTGLLMLGMRYRRPARRGARVIHPETLLRLHAALAAATLALLGAHIVSLLADRWAGVTAESLLVPFTAHYRPGPVAAGTLAAQLLLVVFGTAALAGRPGVRARWAPLHKLAYPAFGLAWAHGLMAGSDSRALLVLYVVAGIAVLGAALPRLFRWGLDEAGAEDRGRRVAPQ